MPSKDDGVFLAECRAKIKEASIQELCKIGGFYGLGFSSRRMHCSEMLGSVAIYYLSCDGKIVVLWQDEATGPVMITTFERIGGIGEFEREVRAVLDEFSLLDQTLSSKINGQLLEGPRQVLNNIWERCYGQGFVSRSRSRQVGCTSDIAGSNITMYDPQFQQIAVCWQKDLTGPVQTAGFVRINYPGKLEFRIYEKTGI